MTPPRFWMIAGFALSACATMEASPSARMPRTEPAEERPEAPSESAETSSATDDVQPVPVRPVPVRPVPGLLRLEPGGEVIGQVYGTLEDDAVGESREVGGETWWPVRPSVTGADRHGLVAWTRDSPALLPDESPAVTAPLRVANGHQAALETDDGTIFARFWCNPINVIQEPTDEDPRTRVRVLFLDGSVALEGFIGGEVTEHGRRCGPRVVQRPMMTRGPTLASDGTVLDPGTPEPVVPVGYVLPVAVAPFRLPRSVWIQGAPIFEDRRACLRWRYRRLPGGGALERRVVVDEPGRGAHATTTTYMIEGHPPTMRMYNRSWEVEILRTDPDGGMPRGPGAVGGVFDLTVVADQSDAITIVEGSRILAYHPDDAGHWYRSVEACEAALPAQEQNVE